MRSTAAATLGSWESLDDLVEELNVIAAPVCGDEVSAFSLLHQLLFLSDHHPPFYLSLVAVILLKITYRLLYYSSNIARARSQQTIPLRHFT